MAAMLLRDGIEVKLNDCIVEDITVSRLGICKCQSLPFAYQRRPLFTGDDFKRMPSLLHILSRKTVLWKPSQAEGPR
jgi:hypothetical protein